ncbi:unnamed protein product [Moneuplotes crassus]|uniref:Uncharacterized protein n=1 Tax=Euplotes crassus TaxID=5936 RepID=A0AAD1Y524_EUPCR|nr:unnamed protein product [Moneuplotes crassus]
MKKNCGLGNNIFWCFYESIIIGARLVERNYRIQNRCRGEEDEMISKNNLLTHFYLKYHE